jgi:hypothetical protein
MKFACAGRRPSRFRFDRNGAAVSATPGSLRRRRKVRICTWEKQAVMEQADQVIAARSGDLLPRLSLDMGL